jgi:putative redox protein
MPTEPATQSPVSEAVFVSETGRGRFQVEVRTSSGAFLADEPVSAGGLGSGPNPYDLLSAALGACTAMTIRLYAARKNWPLTNVQVRVSHSRSSLTARDVFEKTISLKGSLDEAQRDKLREIAERCPVHLTFNRGSDVKTVLAAADDTITIPPPSWEHARGMEEAYDFDQTGTA